jgi:hypothetical protein
MGKGLASAQGMIFDAADSLYITKIYGPRILKVSAPVSPTSRLQTSAGVRNTGHLFGGDGGPATSGNGGCWRGWSGCARTVGEEYSCGEAVAAEESKEGIVATEAGGDDAEEDAAKDATQASVTLALDFRRSHRILRWRIGLKDHHPCIVARIEGDNRRGVVGHSPEQSVLNIEGIDLRDSIGRFSKK